MPDLLDEPRALLVAREQTYALLASLYLAEPGAPVAERLAGLPAFEEIVPTGEALVNWLEDEATEHQWLFSMNIYPYESLFVDSDLMLNTAAAGSAARFYDECGFDYRAYSVGAPDHIGVELSLMRHLIAAERRSLAMENHAEAQWANAQQARFLNEHLAAWGPVCAATMLRIARRPLHRLLATLTIDLLLQDLDAFGTEGSPPRPSSAGCAASPPLPPTQADEEIGEESPLPTGSYSDASREPNSDDEQSLNRLVLRLVTPCSSGIFLTRADISRLASRLDLPVSVGDRFAMARGLFTSAGQFDLLPDLFSALDSLFVGSESSLSELPAGHPSWAEHGSIWLGRIRESRHWLSELAAQAEGM